MNGKSFAASLERRIEIAYRQSGNDCGWRFLSSPAATLDSAKIALIDQTPGGDHQPAAHGKFAMREGSAYELESWDGRPPGESSLQRQIRGLCDFLEVECSEVLAGHFVPFRAPDWESLKNPEYASRFGKSLWTDILDRARPELVITMGNKARDTIAGILDVRSVDKIPVCWGNVKAWRGIFDGGKFVHLPHLSRYKIIGRKQSAAALKSLFR